MDITEALQIGTQLCLQSHHTDSANADVDLPIYNADDAKLDAQILLCHVLQCNRAYLHTWADRALTEAQLAHYQQLVQQRQTGQPVAYILGVQGFYGRDFKVSNDTLIPRPETEQLVDIVLQLVQQQTLAGNVVHSILDLGTGTGAIAITLALALPQVQVTAVDYVLGAVNLAKTNAQQLLPAASTLQLLHSDWFSQVTERFDIIVSNPPYVEPDSPYLLQGDIRFEPNTALTADDNGLADIRLIVAHAPQYLQANGWLLLEHGYQQAPAVQDLMQQHGFTDITTINDYAQQPRITLGQKRD